MGSIITHAISFLLCKKISSTLCISLNSAINVSFATALVTPGEFGRPRVRAPDPDATKKLSL